MQTKDVIKHHRARLKLTEQQLADRIGVSRGSIQQWESGKTAPKRANQEAVALALGITVSELLGIEPASITTSKVRMSMGGGNTETLTIPDGVPLISWIQAGCWADIADPYALGEAEDWLPCPVKHGPRAYCLRVRGDSMYNPGGRPSYSDGDIIFVDPDREAKHGDRVIVRLDDHQEGTFKQFLVEDGRKMLKALNPEWKPRYVEINGHASITGVVIGKWVPE
jgi:SOS-response transcriptional repressor LexA